MPIFKLIRTIVAGVLVFAPLFGGCDDKTQKKAKKKKAPVREEFESDKAPYSAKLPAHWRIETSDEINPHADLAATLDERLFLIVIPQKLPSIEGVEPPDVKALKKATLERMRKNVDKLKVEQEGPVTLEDGSAVSLFAEGMVEENRVQYVATFVTHGGWGYQIIAWGPAESEPDLIESMDSFIGGWHFRSDSLPSRSGDADPANPSKQKSGDTTL